MDRAQLLTRYLPRVLVNKIALAPQLPDKSGESEEFFAACLFADISGFTPLTMRLSEADPAAGADHLTAALNDYFEKLIAIIDEFGGDVVKFAGDALLVLFHHHNEPGTGEDDAFACGLESNLEAFDDGLGQDQSDVLSSLAINACRCALRFQAELSEYRPLLPSHMPCDFTLNMHVGVGVGKIFAFHIGGLNDRWEIVFAGDPISQIASAEPDANNGQVVVSPQTWALTFQHFEGTLVSGSRSKNVLLLGHRPNATDHFENSHLKVGSWLESVHPSAILPGAAMSDQHDRRNGANILALNESAEAVLKSYIPGAVCCRLNELSSTRATSWLSTSGAQNMSSKWTGAAWGNEIRRVAVMFCNMPGLELSSIFLIDRLQLILRSIQTLTYRFEGSVNKFLVDDKGATVVLCFGLPPVSHEDDPARAVGAALAIRAEFQHQGIMTSIGIASGQAFCGTVGAISRCEYTIMGDVVNLAARLMQNARHHGILVDSPTFTAAASRYLFDDSLKPIRVKGRSDPIPVFVPESERDLKSWNKKQSPKGKPIFGREEEKSRILSMLQMVQRQRADLLPTLLIEGDAGSGKSRLVAFVQEQAEKNQFTVVNAEPDAFEDKTAFYSFRSVFSSIFAAEASPSSAMKFDKADQLRHAVDTRFLQIVQEKCLELVPDLMQSLPLLSAVLPMSLPPTEFTRSLSVQAHANATRELLTRILINEFGSRRKQGQRTLLIIDDAQYMDSASWALTVALRNASPDLLIVLAARSESLYRRPEFLELTAADVNVSIKMTPLSNEDTSQLIASTLEQLEPHDVPDELVRLIMARSHGNARLVESWSSYLKEKGLLSIENGKCSMSPEAKNVIIKNDAYAALIMSRLDRLGTVVLTSLKTAACVGHKFAVEMIAQVHPSKEDTSQIRSHLLTAMQEEIVVDLSDDHYQFRNPEIIKILQDSLTSAQKRSIHMAIAEWYLCKHDLGEDAIFPLLARHFLEAQELDRALQYLEQAAAQAMSAYNHDEAIQFYTQLVQIHVSMQERSSSQYRIAKWRHQIADAHYRNGNPNASIDVLIQAFEGLGYSFPRDALKLRSYVFVMLCSLHLHSGIRAFWSGSQPLCVDEHIAACRCMCDVTFDLMMQGSAEGAYFSALKAYSVAVAIDSQGQHGLLPLVCAYLSAVSLSLGKQKQSVTFASRARSLAGKSSDLHLQTFVKVLTAMQLASSGFCSQVSDELVAAVSNFEHHRGSGRLLLAAFSQLISILMLQGNLSQAADYSKKAEKMGTIYGDTICIAYSLGRQAEIAFWQGNMPAAFELMGRLQRLQESHLGLSSLRFQIFIRGFQALIFLRRRECIKAFRVSRRIFDDLTNFGAPLWIHVSTFSFLSSLLLGLLEQPKSVLHGTLGTEADEDRIPLIKDMAERSVQLLANLANKYRIAQPQFKLAQGTLLFSNGDIRGSRKAFQSGLKAAQTMQLEREEALILRELGARHGVDSAVLESHQSFMRMGIRIN